MEKVGENAHSPAVSVRPDRRSPQPSAPCRTNILLFDAPAASWAAPWLQAAAIGRWPGDPGLAERENVTDLETLIGRPLAGALPEGSGALTRDEFRAMALRHLGPTLGGARGRP